MASFNLMITKKIETPPAPLTLRQTIKQMQKRLIERQNEFVQVEVLKLKRFDTPVTLRDVENLVLNAKAIDINANDETVFYVGTRREWTDTKI